MNRLVLSAQQNEITEYEIYRRLGRRVRDEGNRQVLERMAADELAHYRSWREVSGREVAPGRLRVWFFVFISRVLGLSFGLKLMERGEGLALQVYRALGADYPTAEFIADEQRHEAELLDIIKEERVEYAGSIVLGLNDALVELTGALSGLTFAFQNGKIIAITGFITGVAASMSMAASGYLASREEEYSGERSSLKSALYTGLAYIVTVVALILPFVFVDNVYLALAVTLLIAVLVVAAYTFYIATAKSLPFGRRFGEMALISLGVAAISFAIGWLVRTTLGVEI